MIHIYVEKNKVEQIIEALPDNEEIVIKKTSRTEKPVIITIEEETAKKLPINKDNYRNDFKNDSW